MLNVYNSLLKEFGKQENWWPIYSDNPRFEIIIGAILTQNTSWKNVEKALANLRKEDLINESKIIKIKPGELKTLIRPSGFYNQKAERLKLIAEFLSKNKNFTREELLNIKGIGKETADTILLYAFNKPHFVIDAYTKRIMQRLGYKFENYDDLQRLIVKEIPKDYKVYKEFHALLVELAKKNCKKKPECSNCALSRRCKL